MFAVRFGLRIFIDPPGAVHLCWPESSSNNYIYKYIRFKMIFQLSAWILLTFFPSCHWWISAVESLFWSTCFVAAISFLTKRSKRLIFSVFVQAWNIQLCLAKLSLYCQTPSSLWKREKALQTTLNRIWRKNKSWLKVVCTCRNINTVMWRCVHKLACFTIEQIRRKLNT